MILPVSLTLITRATHHLPALEVNLIALLETLLGPLWVWLAIGESPSPEVLAGGLLVVGAVTSIRSALSMRAGVDRDANAAVIVCVVARVGSDGSLSAIAGAVGLPESHLPQENRT